MRKFKRVPVNSVGFVTDEKNHYKIAIQDFSRMGLSFMADTPFRTSSFISIRYQNEIDQIIHMTIYVKNIRRVTNEVFRIGAAFVAIESRN